MAFHVNRYTGPIGPRPHFRQRQRMVFMPPPPPMPMPYGYAQGMSMQGSLWQLGPNGQISGVSDNLGNMLLAKAGNGLIDAGMNWLLGGSS